MPDLERVLQNTPTTISHPFMEGGVVVDPGVTTITITAADGTVVQTTTGTSGTGAAPRTFLLTEVHMALLDRLKLTWDSTTKGTVVSYVEVVGGFLCSLDDLAGLFPSADAAERADIRTAAEERVELAVGRALVPRYSLESRYSYRGLRLTWPNVRAIRSLKLNGVAYSQTEIDSQFYYEGVLLWPMYRPGSRFAGQVTVGYEHGDDYPGENVRKAVLLAAKETFTTTSDGRVIRREADGQAVTYASPASGGGFLDTTLRAIVGEQGGALIG